MADGKKTFQQMSDEDRTSLISEFIYFLKTNKKWWLTPIIVSLAIIGLLAFLAGSGAAPFIYTLF